MDFTHVHIYLDIILYRYMHVHCTVHIIHLIYFRKMLFKFKSMVSCTKVLVNNSTARIIQCFIFILLLRLFLVFFCIVSFCLIVIKFIYFVYICYIIICLYI